MKGLVKSNNLNSKPEPIEKFISSETFSSENSNSTTHYNHNEYESPFLDDDSDWLRLPN